MAAPVLLELILLAYPSTAEAADLLSTMVSSPAAVERDCFARPIGIADGSAARSVTAPSSGLVHARLSAQSGDWDLAVFEAGSGRTVAASAGFGAVEIAEGFIGAARALTVQACRIRGPSEDARLDVSFVPISGGPPTERAALVRVHTPTGSSKRRLDLLGLDVTEHAGSDFVDVVLYGARDESTLRGAGLAYDVVIPDLAALARANALSDIAYRQSVAQSGLPSGNTAYRHLWEYEADMKELARDYPDLVKPFTLPHRTLEGRDVHGIELTSDVNASDGKPVYLQLGLHHAREWPSGEHTMEFAFDLVSHYGNDAGITNLVDRTRTLFVPVVNPDGFNLSREAPIDLATGNGDLSPVTPENVYAVMVLSDPSFSYKRRNCRVVDGLDAPGGICGLPAFRHSGVDPNRNYGAFWGGAGASSVPVDDTYRGASPFSEPETQNVRELIAARQVTTLISNHTAGGLVLRPPGQRATGLAPDERIYRELGDIMAAQNGYRSQYGYELYESNGTTEDWSYWATGGLAYTFEIGPVEFHPPFEQVVEEYTGHGHLIGKGNREAYLLAMASAADPTMHSLLTGHASPGAILRLRKTFVTETSPVRALALFLEPTLGEGLEGDKIQFQDTLESMMIVPSSGQFAWHVNPSTRPITMERRLPTVSDSPSRSQTWTNSERSLPGDSMDRDFQVTAGDAASRLTVTLEWPTPDDYDLEVYYRRADGTLELADGSANGFLEKEVVVIEDPPVGDYVLRVVNFTAVGAEWTLTADLFPAGPDQVIPGTTEDWTFSCETPDGRVLTQEIFVARGQEIEIASPCGTGQGGS